MRRCVQTFYRVWVRGSQDKFPMWLDDKIYLDPDQTITLFVNKFVKKSDADSILYSQNYSVF